MVKRGLQVYLSTLRAPFNYDVSKHITIYRDGVSLLIAVFRVLLGKVEQQR